MSKHIVYKVVRKEPDNFVSAHITQDDYKKTYVVGKRTTATKGTKLFCFNYYEDARDFCTHLRWGGGSYHILKVRGIGKGLELNYYNCYNKTSAIHEFWDLVNKARQHKKSIKKALKHFYGFGHAGTIMYDSVDVLKVM